jgi:hypothetical protein
MHGHGPVERELAAESCTRLRISQASSEDFPLCGPGRRAKFRALLDEHPACATLTLPAAHRRPVVTVPNGCGHQRLALCYLKDDVKRQDTRTPRLVNSCR